MRKKYYTDDYGCAISITEEANGSFQAKSKTSDGRLMRNSNHTKFEYALRALRKDTDGLRELPFEGDLNISVDLNSVYKDHTDQMLEKIYFDIQINRDQGLISPLIRPGAHKLWEMLNKVPTLGQCLEMSEKKLMEEIAIRFFTKLNEEPEESGFFVMVDGLDYNNPNG